MKNFPKPYKFSLRDEEGATAVEYAVLLALIAVVIIFSVGFLGVSTRDGFDTVNTAWSDTYQSEDDDACGNEDSPDDKDCGHGND